MSQPNEKYTEAESTQGRTITFERDCKIPYNVFVDKVVSTVLMHDFVDIDEGNNDLVVFLRKVTVNVHTAVRGPLPDFSRSKAVKKTQSRKKPVKPRNNEPSKKAPNARRSNKSDDRAQ